MDAHKAALKCLCGQSFANPQDRHKHQQARGHILFCSCNRPCKNANSLKQHQLDTSHSGQKTYAGLEVKPPPPPRNVCPICNKKCANEDGRMAHESDKHPACPTCQQHFASRPQRDGHQIVTGHSYCDEHCELFASLDAYTKHKGDSEHVKSYECVDCDRAFASQRALDHHLESAGHAAATLAALDRANETESAAAAQALAAAKEEESLRCEQCQRDFKSLQGFKDHKASVKHKPLSKLGCPLSAKCKKHFASPSALLLHLESGACKSGMNRLKLNVLIYQHDTGRQITRSKNFGSVIADAGAAGAIPPASDLAMSLETLSLAGIGVESKHVQAATDLQSSLSGITVEDVSDMESTTSGVLIPTPSRSRASSITGGVVLTPSGSASEWSFINHKNPNKAFTPSTSDIQTESRIALDPKTGLWPCYVSGCPKSFKNEKRLQQHLYSPFHASKIFHCPTSLVMEGKEHEQVFKTISGFAMHLESGNCVGGKEALAKIAGLFEKKIAMVTGKGVKLLLEQE
ncbi:hypothetical protein CBER1_07961 [Cercospora berteroae]|uniref:C2H2-type domain-containing protein n=1 Tax=Cercospora berteroae TaxID=357750 RepID=A0A2S6BVL9_9PEZI|nr:hypothetical protein CBER1_07961 [Cercospora berteroae]